MTVPYVMIEHGRVVGVFRTVGDEHSIDRARSYRDQHHPNALLTVVTDGQSEYLIAQHTSTEIMS